MLIENCAIYFCILEKKEIDKARHLLYDLKLRQIKLKMIKNKTRDKYL